MFALMASWVKQARWTVGINADMCLFVNYFCD